ncbi:MAG: hypothetical protein ACYDC6_05650 [Acidobacteriaceae bacterium]
MKRHLNDADRVRGYANEQYIEPVRQNAGGTVRIKAGDIVKGLGLKNKTPNVCTALRSKIFQEQYGLELLEEQGPPSGMSTTVVFTYRILNQGQTKGTNSASSSSFDRLRGIGKKAFESVGGGECFIESERRNFYGKIDDKRQGKRG